MARHARRHGNPHRDGLAVQVGAVAGVVFDGVAEGVAQIERGAEAGLSLVVSHDRSLILTTSLNGFADRLGMSRRQRSHVLFLPLEEGGVADETVLDDFRHARGVLAFGQSVQRVHVDQDAARLVKRADHVLALGVVHRRLPADGRVDHGHERRRDLNEVDASLIHRRGEADEVADDAASQSDEARTPVQRVLQRKVHDLLQVV
mmetsp:Transcript_24634/g.76094  ORF Transcript_24634/g.76094 Transcript_24634/m.76094 type:complete len:204 (-) Transcript_24634:373-984(-)